jgi:hypothetical protein
VFRLAVGALIGVVGSAAGSYWLRRVERVRERRVDIWLTLIPALFTTLTNLPVSAGFGGEEQVKSAAASLDRAALATSHFDNRHATRIRRHIDVGIEEARLSVPPGRERGAEFGAITVKWANESAALLTAYQQALAKRLNRRSRND